MKLKIVPIDFKTAKIFINENHRHHISPVGWKFGIGVVTDNAEQDLVGVVTAGRPVARRNNDGYTIEITRLCTVGTKNACSKLYAAAVRVAKNLGYTRVITYILKDESGASVRAAGFQFSHGVKGATWSVPSRPRIDKHPTVDKACYEYLISGYHFL